MSDDKRLTENGLLSEFHYQPHTEIVTHRVSQPNEDLILERNSELRKQPEAFASNDYMEQVASIPIVMWEQAIREGYQLNACDNQIADRELFRFLRSENGKKCMVTERKV